LKAYVAEKKIFLVHPEVSKFPLTVSRQFRVSLDFAKFASACPLHEQTRIAEFYWENFWIDINPDEIDRIAGVEHCGTHFSAAAKSLNGTVEMWEMVQNPQFWKEKAGDKYETGAAFKSDYLQTETGMVYRHVGDRAILFGEFVNGKFWQVNASPTFSIRIFRHPQMFVPKWVPLDKPFLLHLLYHSYIGMIKRTFRTGVPGPAELRYQPPSPLHFETSHRDYSILQYVDDVVMVSRTKTLAQLREEGAFQKLECPHGPKADFTKLKDQGFDEITRELARCFTERVQKESCSECQLELESGTALDEASREALVKIFAAKEAPAEKSLKPWEKMRANLPIDPQLVKEKWAKQMEEVFEIAKVNTELGHSPGLQESLMFHMVEVYRCCSPEELAVSSARPPQLQPIVEQILCPEALRIISRAMYKVKSQVELMVASRERAEIGRGNVPPKDGDAAKELSDATEDAPCIGEEELKEKENFETYAEYIKKLWNWQVERMFEGAKWNTVHGHFPGLTPSLAEYVNELQNDGIQPTAYRSPEKVYVDEVVLEKNGPFTKRELQLLIDRTQKFKDRIETILQLPAFERYRVLNEVHPPLYEFNQDQDKTVPPLLGEITDSELTASDKPAVGDEPKFDQVD